MSQAREPAPTHPGDVVGFYRALGIELPTWGGARNASVRCFADPEAHAHHDRSKSMSVELQTGAFRCHGGSCGARGGAYDAALVLGRSPREAIELMIRFGLRDERQRDRTRVDARPRPEHIRPTISAVPQSRTSAITLEVGVADIGCWQRALHARPGYIDRLVRERAWKRPAITALLLGFDRGRVTIPVYHPDGRLAAVRRYRPFDRGHAPKMLNIPGGHSELYPCPEHVGMARGPILLCEGEPDAIAAASYGLPATSIPGDQAWCTRWAPRLSGRLVVICMDADAAGRTTAARIADDLAPYARSVRVLDPAPGVDDHSDLTDMLLTGRINELLRELIRHPHDPARDRADDAWSHCADHLPSR